MLMNPTQPQVASPMMTDEEKQQLLQEQIKTPTPVVQPKPVIPAMNQPQTPVQSAGGNHFNLSYEKQLEDAFYKAMQEREGQNKKFQDDYDQLKQKPTTFADVNLRPALAFADSLMGTNTANTYQAPTGVDGRKTEMQKLQDAIMKNQNSMADDQINYLKMKASEENQRRRDAKLDNQFNKQMMAGEDGLRREYLNSPTYKNSNEIMTAYNSIQGNPAEDPNSTPSDHQALVMQFNKLLDPGSVVKEGEYARSAQGAAAIDRLKMAIAGLKEGNKLPPDVVRGIKLATENLVNSTKSVLESQKDTYRELAKTRGYNPGMVVIDPIGGIVKTNKKVTVHNAKTGKSETLINPTQKDLLEASIEGYQVVK